MANNVLYAATAAVACVAQGVWSVQRGAQEGSHRQTHCGQQGQRTRIHHTQPAGKWGVCMDGWLAGFATGLHPSFSCTLASPLQDISPQSCHSVAGMYAPHTQPTGTGSLHMVPVVIEFSPLRRQTLHEAHWAGSAASGGAAAFNLTWLQMEHHPQ